VSVTEPLVSVVTPFYNTADYLDECIQSVLAQTHRNFELILVDNRSTDGSHDVAARWVGRDARVRLEVNPTFVGQVPNYNGALRHISPASKYTKIVQADDTIGPRCLTEMVALADAHPSMAVVSAYRMSGTHVQPDEQPHANAFIPGREAARVVLEDDNLYMFGSPTTLLFRSDLVRGRNPFYDEARFFEDVDVVYDLLREHDFGFVHQILSFTRLETGSIWGHMRGYRPRFVSRLLQLKLHGPHFLTAEEQARHWQAHHAAYVRFLAWAWVRRRDDKFWEFHRKALASAGIDLDQLPYKRAALRSAPRLVGTALVEWGQRRFDVD
jgi:glycosyltransferase involved in cell wall biosynthesis